VGISLLVNKSKYGGLCVIGFFLKKELLSFFEFLLFCLSFEKE